ncbi:subtilisin-like protein [Colletotrichum falcatum]|nr:subtilisin-like protein [Colletotrichum falcatum]
MITSQSLASPGSISSPQNSGRHGNQLAMNNQLATNEQIAPGLQSTAHAQPATDDTALEPFHPKERASRRHSDLEININIHGNELTLRGDGLGRRAQTPSRLNVAALSISDPRRSATAGSVAAPEEDDPNSFVLVALSDASTKTKKDVEAAGAKLLSYVDNEVYLCRWDATKEIRLLQATPGVRLVDPYPPSVKIHADLQSELDDLRHPQRPAGSTSAEEPDSIGVTGAAMAAPMPLAADALISLQVHFHKGTAHAKVQEAKERWSSAGAIKGDSAEVFDLMIVAEADPTKVDQIAAVPDVFVIEVDPELGDDNVYATDVVNVSGVSLSSNGYHVEQFPDMPYDGTGETISIGDSGFDRGPGNDMADAAQVHPAFPALNDRYRFFCMGDAPGAAVQSSCTRDTRGHGTHVCGTAVGSSQGPSFSGAGNNGYIKGAAPGARLFFTQTLDHNVDDEKRKIYKGPMEDIYNKSVGAVSPGWPKPIFSQSWGVTRDKPKPKPGYTTKVETFDTFLMAENTLVCRSAGNDRKKFPAFPGTCGLLAAGKNVLTVGACESSTSVWTQPYSDVSSNAGKAPLMKAIPGNPRVMYTGSCYGTREYGRQKPDVVAPGVKVLSACSRDAPAAAPGQPQPNPPSPPLDPSYTFKTGTSMATPLVAGCAAVLNQALRATDRSYTGQSGMLLKALLVNGAVVLDAEDPQYVKGTERPWGFGRVNMLGSLQHLANKGAVKEATYARGELGVTESAGTCYFDVSSPKGTPGSPVNDASPQGVKITLCWADEGHKSLTCLFYFTLTQESTKRVWFGNRDGWVDAADAADQTKRKQYADDVNNVQQIYCKNLDPGRYQINAHFYEHRGTGTATATRVPYGLAWLLF